MKRHSWIATSLLVLALSLVAKAGPLEDAQEANSVALGAALSAYSEANGEYLQMSS